MSLLQTERATYAEMWASVPAYSVHAPGEQYLQIFQAFASPGATVLDAGTGSGKGAVALHRAGYIVGACDVTDAGLVDEARDLPFMEACLWDVLMLGPVFDSGSCDWVYCTDVLEHIPPQFTMLAIHQMLRVAREGLFLTVSLVPDSFGVWAGKSLHQSVFPFSWWKEALNEVGTVVEARDLISNAVFVVRPR
jgi:2-polyprenyl-3-methyl-5-hydroxy-6-metoxy-1,4-benzoquinol methylase